LWLWTPPLYPSGDAASVCMKQYSLLYQKTQELQLAKAVFLQVAHKTPHNECITVYRHFGPKTLLTQDTSAPVGCCFSAKGPPQSDHNPDPKLCQYCSLPDALCSSNLHSYLALVLKLDIGSTGSGSDMSLLR